MEFQSLENWVKGSSFDFDLLKADELEVLLLVRFLLPTLATKFKNVVEPGELGLLDVLELEFEFEVELFEEVATREENLDQ